MVKILRGKYLVRKGTLANGEKVLTLTGVFHPNFSLDEIKDNDEMWVSDIIINGGIKFTDPVNFSGACSPEEFLLGEYQSPEDWKTKSELK